MRPTHTSGWYIVLQHKTEATQSSSCARVPDDYYNECDPKVRCWGLGQSTHAESGHFFRSHGRTCTPTDTGTRSSKGQHGLKRKPHPAQCLQHTRSHTIRRRRNHGHGSGDMGASSNELNCQNQQHANKAEQARKQTRASRKSIHAHTKPQLCRPEIMSEQNAPRGRTS